MNWLQGTCDAVVDAVSPKRGNQRKAARLLRERYEANRERAANRARRDESEYAAGGFQSAQNGRDARSWLTSRLSPDSALEDDRQDMVDRVDSAVKNYPLAANHVEGRVTRVVGSGMTIDPEIGFDESEAIAPADAERWNATLRTNWERTCERIGRNGEEFWEIQQQCHRDYERRGEYFLLIGDEFDPLSPVTLKVEVIDPDRVSTPDGKAGDKSIRMGIQLDAKGRAIGCWIRSTHPGDTLDISHTWKYEPFAYKNGLPRVIHHFDRIFRGQHRGFPQMQVGTKRLKNAEEYDEAELERNFVASCHVGVIRTDLDISETIASHGAVEDADGKRIRSMLPGQFFYGGLADEITFNSPSGPTATFGPYMEYEGRQFAAACLTSYELLTGDWKGMSYSTARLLFNVENGRVAVLQLAHEKTAKWIYRHFVSRAILTGMIDVDPVAYRSNPWTYWAARVVYPPNPSIDPSREDRNEMVLIEAGFKPGSDLIERLNGKPARDVYKAVQRDRKLRKDCGLEEHLPQMGRDQELTGEPTGRPPTQRGDRNQEASDANRERQAVGT